MNVLYPALRRIAAASVPLAMAFAQPVAAEIDAANSGISNPTGPVTLADAVSLALKNNPGLAAFAWDIRAAEARRIQAGLRPNPVLDVLAEDVRLGDGPRQRSSRSSRFSADASLSAAAVKLEREQESGVRGGFAEAQWTVSLSQVIELGGKRAKRLQLADRDRETVSWDYEIARADTLKQVAQAFIRTVVAQRRLALDDEQVQLAEQVRQTVTAKVDAGRVSPLEAAKAETALSTSQVRAERSRRELQAARTTLAVTWGEKEALFDHAAGDLDVTQALPPLSELSQRVSASPELMRWNAELEKRDAVTAVERSKATPDLTVTAGFRRAGQPERQLRTTGVGSDGVSYSRTSSRADAASDNSIVLGFSIPLPFSNRNQGAIQESQRLAAKGAEERRATDVRISAALFAAYQELSAAETEITTLRATVLPTATRTFESIREAYQQGKFAYLDVLDAQRTLFDARQAYLDALATYHEDVAELERFTGSPLWPNGNTALSATKGK